MKKRRSLFSLVIMSFVFSSFFVGTVAASDFYLTSTPTRNPKTPPPTPTPGGSGSIFGTGSAPNNYVCPVGTIQGYGQVTPDALWMAACGHCLPTGTVYPTFDFDEFSTRTPIVWVSGTPATPGPHMELTYTPFMTHTPFVTLTAFSSSTPGVEPTMGTRILTYTDNTHGVDTCGASASATINVSSYYTGLRVDYSFTCSSSSNRSIRWNINFTDTAGGSQPYYWVLNGSKTGSFTDLPSFDNYTGTNPDDNASGTTVSSQRNMQFYAVATAPWTASGTFYIMPQPMIGTQTPTPNLTVTPTEFNYCSSINNGMGLSNQDMSFWEPAGPPACMFIPAFDSTDLFNFDQMPTWLGIFLGGFIQIDRIQEMIEGGLLGFQVYTKAMTICLQPYEFAPVYIFGTVMLLQTVIDIGLGLFFIQFLRSR